MKTGKPHSLASVRASLTLGIMVVFLVLGGVVALYIRIHETSIQRKELKETRRRLRQQEILHPLYQELQQAVMAPVGSALPCPPRQPLARSEIIGIPNRFLKDAERCGLKLGAVSPHLGEEGDLSRQLQVEVQASGTYGQLRAFLLGLMAWPSFMKVERIEIRQNRMQEEFSLSIRLLLD